MKRSKDIIRVNDIVQIKTPELFVRCGYPMSKQDAVDHIKANHINDINELFYKITKKDPECRKSYMFSNEYRCFDNIVDNLAFQYLIANDFGGEKRQIHTEFHKKYLYAVGKVTKIKKCVTGRYIKANHGYDYYYGGWEYEPPYLQNQKHHKILCVDMVNENLPPHAFTVRDEIWIEDCHVEKVKKDERKHKCKCNKKCKEPCKGTCGCNKCNEEYQDFLSCER